VAGLTVQPDQQTLRLEVLPQPNNTTCGPTCLHAVYRFYGEDLDLNQVIDEVTPLESGGTLAVFLACHALERGYRATIYTYNLQLFDPSWFNGSATDVRVKLREQLDLKKGRRLATATRAYLRFFELGGRLRYEELNPALIRRHLKRGTPILTGLSATYLYGCPRELNNEYDDVNGDPAGHFVVLCGYDPETRLVRIGDPLHNNPRFRSQNYDVEIDRLINSILLGIVTYDANLLIIEQIER